MSLGYIKDGKYVEAAGLGYGGGWCGMPDWGHAQKVTFDSNWQYTAPDDGYIIGRAQANDNSTAQLYIDNIIVSVTRYINGSYVTYASVQVPINKGDVLSVQGGTLQEYALAFVPFKAASAGEGLSAAAVKQLRWLNYDSGYVDITDKIVLNPSNVAAITSISLLNEGASYHRYGNMVEITAAFAITASSRLSNSPNLIDFRSIDGLPMPASQFCIGTFATRNVENNDFVYAYMRGKKSPIGDSDAIGSTWYDMPAGTSQPYYLQFRYITDDPIPGEEE